MRTEYVNTSIQCQPGAKLQLSEMAEERGGFSARGERFICTECYARWDASAFSGSMEPDTVTCSNCYGDKVIIWQVRIQVIEEGDFT